MRLRASGWLSWIWPFLAAVASSWIAFWAVLIAIDPMGWRASLIEMLRALFAAPWGQIIFVVICATITGIAYLMTMPFAEAKHRWMLTSMLAAVLSCLAAYAIGSFVNHYGSV